MNGCFHCVKFMPVWNEFSKSVSSMNNNSAKFVAQKYEIGELKQEPTIEGEAIQGFPTVKITVEKGGDKKEYDYLGKRTVPDLMSFLNMKAKDAIKNK